MIRGFSGRITLVLFLVALVQSSEFQKLQITKATRLVNLASGYAAESIKISFVSNDEGITHFSYLLPTEYDQKISKIWFTKSEKDRSTLSYTKKIASHGKIAYSEYKVTLPSKSNIGDLGNIHVHITYLYRYVNLPASITLTEDQKLQYEDVKFIISPYHVLEQETIYKMHKVLDVEQDGVKKSMGEVAFTKSSIEPFTVFRHTVFGVNNSPLVQFTEVERVIDVSHWGNVGIVEHYKILNKGPQLKGQFSRVTFGSRGDSVKNSFKGIEFDLPSEIWGLYYLDQVGNISTSRAFRDNSKQVVHVGLTPRFALLGGWKSNWQIGYNFNTLGHLFHSGSRFQLKNIKLEYALQRILAEHYTIKVILPDGAHNARVKIGGHVYDSSSLQVGRSEGYLDFNGRPTYIIPNYRGNLADKNIEVEYDYDQTKVYEKIIILIVIVLVFLGSAILAKRFKLEAFESSKQD